MYYCPDQLPQNQYEKSIMERYYGRDQKCRLGSVPEIRKEQVPSAG
jgi:hypothetical protein